MIQGAQSIMINFTTGEKMYVKNDDIILLEIEGITRKISNGQIGIVESSQAELVRIMLSADANIDNKLNDIWWDGPPFARLLSADISSVSIEHMDGSTEDIFVNFENDDMGRNEHQYITYQGDDLWIVIHERNAGWEVFG